jgi:hypothetical protein
VKWVPICESLRYYGYASDIEQRYLALVLLASNLEPPSSSYFTLDSESRLILTILALVIGTLIMVAPILVTPITDTAVLRLLLFFLKLIIIILVRIAVLRVVHPIITLDPIPEVLTDIHRLMPVTEGRDANEHRSTRVLDVKFAELFAKL